ncbi:MAG: hypothetical protein E7015_02995 [Alphaproteobacteria bacterium]|nr:hypothetical protein [Alphaproteobacteria bacterium]
MNKIFKASVLCFMVVGSCNLYADKGIQEQHSAYTFEMNQENGGPVYVSTETYGIRPDGSKYHEKKQGTIEDGIFKESDSPNSCFFPKSTTPHPVTTEEHKNPWSHQLRERSKVPTWRTFWQKFSNNTECNKNNITDESEKSHLQSKFFQKSISELKELFETSSVNEKRHIIHKLRKIIGKMKYHDTSKKIKLFPRHHGIDYLKSQKHRERLAPPLGQHLSNVIFHPIENDLITSEQDYPKVLYLRFPGDE